MIAFLLHDFKLKFFVTLINKGDKICQNMFFNDMIDSAKTDNWL